MAESESAEMNKAEYWDKRYQSADDQPPQEWHLSYDDLEAYLKEDPLAPGDAQQGRGYTDITCAEFSAAVIAQMQPLDPAIRWLECDVRDMRDIESNSYDIVFDKACFEALCGWGTKHLLKEIPEVQVVDTRRYSQEVDRVLKPGGWFIIICVFEPRFVHHMLKCEGTSWEDVHLPKSLTPDGWMQTRAYCLRKPGPKPTEAP
ncbi:hypothetical protein PG984_007554 [Apiospora sp. TS-2023a]